MVQRPTTEFGGDATQDCSVGSGLLIAQTREGGKDVSFDCLPFASTCPRLPSTGSVFARFSADSWLPAGALAASASALRFSRIWPLLKRRNPRRSVPCGSALPFAPFFLCMYLQHKVQE